MMLEWIAGALIILGSAVVVIGAIGLAKLADVFARLHASSLIDTAGAGLMLFGMILISPSWLVAAKLVFIGVFLFFTSPITGHAIGQGAYKSDKGASHDRADD